VGKNVSIGYFARYIYRAYPQISILQFDTLVWVLGGRRGGAKSHTDTYVCDHPGNTLHLNTKGPYSNKIKFALI
jgi:hypothetical protein